MPGRGPGLPRPRQQFLGPGPCGARPRLNFGGPTPAGTDPGSILGPQPQQAQDLAGQAPPGPRPWPRKTLKFRE